MNSVWDTAEAVGFPIRKFTDQSLLAAPRDLSQRATSFIASQCQGIHQMPFRRLISTPTKTLAPRAGTSLLANQPTGLVVSAVRCYSQPGLWPGRGASSVTCTSSSLVHDPAPAPQQWLGAHERARSARSCSRFRVVVPSNGSQNRAADHPRSTPDVLLGNWWRQTGSNRRPPACKAGALPTELCPRSAIRTTAKHGGPGRI